MNIREAKFARHLMYIIFVQAYLLFNLLIREIEFHQIQAGDSGLQGLMATRKGYGNATMGVTLAEETKVMQPPRNSY